LIAEERKKVEAEATGGALVCNLLRESRRAQRRVVFGGGRGRGWAGWQRWGAVALMLLRPGAIR